MRLAEQIENIDSIKRTKSDAKYRKYLKQFLARKKRRRFKQSGEIIPDGKYHGYEY